MKAWISFFATAFCLLAISMSAHAGKGVDLFLSSLYPFERVNKNNAPVPEVAPEPFQRINLSNEKDLQIVSWVMPSSEANPLTVIYFHGNGENLSSIYESKTLISLLAELPVNIVLYDYPGYGLSRGPINQATMIEAGQLVMKMAKEKFPKSSIVLWGWSLGAAVATQIAAQPENKSVVKGLVLSSPWNRVLDSAERARALMPAMVTMWLPKTLELVTGHEYDSAAAASRISAPTLVMHGAADKTIPVDLGTALAEKFGDKAKFQIFEGLDHHGIISSPLALNLVFDFLSKIPRVQPQSDPQN